MDTLHEKWAAIDRDKANIRYNTGCGISRLTPLWGISRLTPLWGISRLTPLYPTKGLSYAPGTHVTHFVQLYPQPLYTASQMRSWDKGVLTDLCLTLYLLKNNLSFVQEQTTNLHTHTHTHIQLHLSCCNPIHKPSPKPIINSLFFNENYSYSWDLSYSQIRLYRHEGDRILWFQIATITYQYHKQYQHCTNWLDHWLSFTSWVQGVS